MSNFIINTMKKIGFKINNILVVFECTNNTFNKLKSVEFNVNIVDLTDIDSTLTGINVSIDVGIVLLLLMENAIDYNSIINIVFDSYHKSIDNDLEFQINIKELMIIFRTIIRNRSNDINIVMFNINISNAMTNRFQFLI